MGANEVLYYNNQVKWFSAREDLIRAQAEKSQTQFEILKDNRDIPVAEWSERHAFYNTADGRKVVDASHDYERTAKASAAATEEADTNWSNKTALMSKARNANYIANQAVYSGKMGEKYAKIGVDTAKQQGALPTASVYQKALYKGHLAYYKKCQAKTEEAEKKAAPLAAAYATAKAAQTTAKDQW